MDLKGSIKKYLASTDAMQLATVSDGHPWLCTVHFVSDEDLNIYWLSTPARRHSQHVASDPKTAIAVAIKTDKPVLGIQASGSTHAVNEKEEVARVMTLYSLKHDGSGKDFYDNFLNGTNEHLLFKFTAHEFGLFDELNSPGKGRQELHL